MDELMTFEEECLAVIDLFKKGIIEKRLRTRYPGDGILIDTFISDSCILAISNIHEDAKNNQNTYLRALYVIEPLRNKGYGSTMLHNVIGACKELGVKAIETEPLNKKSQKFFVKHGFKKIKDSPHNRHILHL